MKFISLTIGILMTFIVILPAQSVGTTSFEFLKNQYSARGAAMGGNLVAIKGDINSLMYNPAAMAGIAQKQWTVNYVDHLLDFQGGFLSYAQPHSRFGNLSVGLVYFNYGDFNVTDDFGEKSGETFGASEFALQFGLSNFLADNLSYGVSAKFIYSAIENYNASGFAIDGGLFYTAEFLDNTNFGISVMNLGKALDNYTDYEDKFPLMLRIGASKRLTHLPLLLSASLIDVTASEDKFTDRLKRFAFGGEFEISPKIRLRLGYQNEIHRSVKPLSRNVFGGVSFGLGMFWRNFRLDYAYSNFGDLGSQNRIGISSGI